MTQAYHKNAVLSAVSKKRKKPVPIILGTDWWTDCDDAVAIRVLAQAEKAGCIKLCAVAVSAYMPFSARSIDIFLANEGLPDIPLGIDRDAVDYGGSPAYQKMLCELEENRSNRSDVQDAVKLYRKVLSEATERLDLVEIGYPQILAALLQSAPDEFSDADGLNLIKQKVRKLWMMAGNWESLESGKENNFSRNKRACAAGAYLCENFPCEITFLGWEVADKILTGSRLDSNDMLAKILKCRNYTCGRSSWDPMLALLAVIGDEAAAGYDTVCGKASVDAETGINHFEVNSNGKHRIVRKNQPDDFYKTAVDSIITLGETYTKTGI